VADELLVVDSGSTDATLEIVGRFAQSRVIQSEFRDISSQRNVYLQEAVGDLILVLDADEVMGAGLSEILPRLLASEYYTHYWFPRYWVAALEPLCYLENEMNYPDHQMRLFRRSRKLSYQGAVHQQISVDGPCAFLVQPHIFHLHFLLHDRMQREDRLTFYESLQTGAGSGIYRPFYIFEEFPYRVRLCRERLSVDLGGVARTALPASMALPDESKGRMEDHLDLTLANVLPRMQRRILEETTYFGIATLKNPLDFWVYQELITSERPDVIVEIGTAAGGSALALAHLCDQLDHGRVISIDVSQAGVAEATRRHARICLVEGDAVARFDEVAAQIDPDESVLVIEDSSQTCENTLAVLRSYSGLVRPGVWLIVEDGICHHGLTVGPGHGPHEAVDAFLGENPQFVADRSRESFFITWNPKGFLRREA
jgi:cephalosporin hydroxylase